MVPGPLEVHEPHDGQQVSDVEARPRRVESHVHRPGGSGQVVHRPVGRVVQQSTPA